MKGIVFNELMELVESKFGMQTADEIISENEADLSTGGAYTSTGTYNYTELLSLVTSLSNKTQLPVRDLVLAFGGHLAGIFAKKYPDFFSVDDYFEFLKSVDDYVHVEVKKLYPDAELPKFQCRQTSENQLIMEYRSKRPFADLAEGLILASAQHFGVEIEIEARDVECAEGVGRDFTISRVSRS